MFLTPPSFNRKYLPESPRLHYILGLNLLRLLSSNRIAEFHTELELISYENQDNPFIKHPIQLEQYLMEGCYNKVLETKEEFPSASYVYFMNQLIDTIRDEIAECIQAAYLTLPVQGAKRLLLFETEEQVLDFSQKVRLLLPFIPSLPLPFLSFLPTQSCKVLTKKKRENILGRMK